MDKVNELATTIDARGLGHAKAVELGRKYAHCDNPSNPELWFKGLPKASARQIRLAIAEWADGDSVAAHYGYGLDLFCTHDTGKNASGASILDAANRKWLSETHGVRFVTLSELAEIAMASGAT
ncbi:MAG: hypothetical protein WDN02_03025 [Methylovirgula sp.]|uniref:hypothetical protein n=1 Tax=Methylovirgula sp. TaxID=1978224 RepID=UPI003075F177